jgi:hypothetical protein
MEGGVVSGDHDSPANHPIAIHADRVCAERITDTTTRPLMAFRPDFSPAAVDSPQRQ